jgi:hypothetical protein
MGLAWLYVKLTPMGTAVPLHLTIECCNAFE